MEQGNGKLFHNVAKETPWICQYDGWESSLTQDDLYLYSVCVDLLWVWGRFCSCENLLNIVTFVQIYYFIYPIR